MVHTFHCGFAATVANDRGALDRSAEPVPVDGFVFFVVHLHLFALESERMADAQRTRTDKSLRLRGDGYRPHGAANLCRLNPENTTEQSDTASGQAFRRLGQPFVQSSLHMLSTASNLRIWEAHA